jgi:type I restriction enzyme, S subunit
MKRQYKTLGELCNLVKGTSPISKTVPGQYPLVTTGEEHKTADSFQFDAEAVCIPLISSTGHGHASLKRVHYQTGKFALANLLTAALIKDPLLLSAKFLARYLMFMKDRLIVPLMTGAANMSISIDRLATVPVEFPPLAEQDRIVKLLDEADEMRKLRAQADRRSTDLRPAIFHEMFGDPAVNPRRWKLTAISDIAEVQGGVQLTPVRDAYALKRPYLRVANVQRGFLVLDEIKEIGLLDAEYERTKLMKGDLLLVEGNGNPLEVGRAAIWDGSVEGCVHQNHLIRVRPHGDLLTPDYLLAFVNSESARSYFHGSGNTTSGLVTISTSIVKNCRIPVPPQPLQKEFAARVADVRELQQAQEQSRKHLEALFQSSQNRAFEGEL